MIVKRVLLFLMLIFSFSALYSEKNSVNEAFLNFVNLPNESNYIKAVSLIEKKEFNFDQIPSEFFPLFQKLIEKSNLLAFNLLKKISLKPDDLYYYVVDSVRNLMVKDFDFFLNNISELESNSIKKLFVEDFLDMDDSVKSYEFYIIVLKRAKSVEQKELMENAKKIEQIVSSILKDKGFMRNIKYRQESINFAIKFCQKYETGVNELIKFVSENEAIVKEYFSYNPPMVYCYNRVSEINGGNISDSFKRSSQYRNLIYHSYMSFLLSKSVVGLKEPLRSYINAIIKDIKRMVGKGQKNIEYLSFLDSFFVNPEEFLNKFKKEYFLSTAWIALDLSLITKCNKKELEYKTSAESIKKLLQKKDEKQFNQFLVEMEHRLKDNISQSCDDFSAVINLMDNNNKYVCGEYESITETESIYSLHLRKDGVAEIKIKGFDDNYKLVYNVKIIGKWFLQNESVHIFYEDNEDLFFYIEKLPMPGVKKESQGLKFIKSIKGKSKINNDLWLLPKQRKQ